MSDDLFRWLLLGASAFVAGIVNAVAGGGTLLTFSALVAVLNPVHANATSTLALWPASIAAAWGYRQELSESRRHLTWLWPPSLIGGIVGSLLVIKLPDRVFASAVPWLLVAASVLLLVQRPMQRWIGAHPHAKPSRRTLAAIIFFQLLVGIYGGYFGAGIGILMLSSLAFMGIPDIHHMNGVKNVLGATMNGITVVIFALAGVIVLKYALAMALAATLGGYAGARVARRMRPAYVRAVVVAIGFAVAFYSWYSRR